MNGILFEYRWLIFFKVDKVSCTHWINVNMHKEDWNSYGCLCRFINFSVAHSKPHKENTREKSFPCLALYVQTHEINYYQITSRFATLQSWGRKKFLRFFFFLIVIFFPCISLKSVSLSFSRNVWKFVFSATQTHILIENCCFLSIHFSCLNKLLYSNGWEREREKCEWKETIKAFLCGIASN